MEPARRGLQKIALELVRSAPEAERPIVAWPLACGAAVTEKTHAIAFADGVLTVEVPDAAWRTQLREMSGQYLAALRQTLGETVKRIEFVLPAEKKSAPTVKVTEKDVLYVADLANLELTPAERERMVRDLNSILGHIDMLNELDTTNSEPMSQASDRFGPVAGKTAPGFHNGMRADEVGVVRVGGEAGAIQVERPSLPRDVVLQNAPESDGACFKVPKVIER